MFREEMQNILTSPLRITKKKAKRRCIFLRNVRRNLIRTVKIPYNIRKVKLMPMYCLGGAWSAGVEIRQLISPPPQQQQKQWR